MSRSSALTHNTALAAGSAAKRTLTPRDIRELATPAVPKVKLSEVEWQCRVLRRLADECMQEVGHVIREQPLLLAAAAALAQVSPSHALPFRAAVCGGDGAVYGGCAAGYGCGAAVYGCSMPQRQEWTQR
eukprot:1778540-Rhodomonas_salina.2